jgi:glycosyltransferase involved in cell wall biosynthesis
MQVSVIVPTRNRRELLPTTLCSALGQRGVDLEVLIIDDASDDDTAAVAHALADGRVRVIRLDTPSGVSMARNRGVAAARGEWLAFLDDDDLWAPDKLARQLAAARESGRDWAYTGGVVFLGDRIVRAQVPLPPDAMVKTLLRYDAIPGGGSNVIMRRALWPHTGPFDTQLRSGEDWEMWIRLAKHGIPAWVCAPLVAKRLHSTNATLDTSEIINGSRYIERLHDIHADWGILHQWMGHLSLRVGHRRAALRHFARAVAHGEVRKGLGDAIYVIREVLGFGFRRTNNQGSDSRDGWIAEAELWLREFLAQERRRCDARDVRRTLTS